MASGHANRTHRPNTWLLRPTPQVKILLANREPSTHGPKRPTLEGRSLSAPPQNSDVNLFCYRERVIDLDPEIADGAIDFRVTQQELDRTQVAGPPIY